MKLDNFNARIRRVAAQLSTILEQRSQNEKVLADTHAELEKVQRDRAALENERNILESASALALHRLKLTPEEAAKRSDSLRTEVEKLMEAESAAALRAEELKRSLDADWQEIRRLGKEVNNAARVYSSAELIAWLSSVIDRGDMFYEEQHNFRLFPQSFANAVYEKREFSMSHNQQLLKVAQEISEQPIVPLQQGNTDFPDSARNTPLGEAIASALVSDAA